MSDAKVTPTALIREDDPEAADVVDAAKLLGPARMVLDRCAEGLPGSREEAADMAQRIVDLIGHSVTDEPPHALVELERLRSERAAMTPTFFPLPGAWPAETVVVWVRGPGRTWTQAALVAGRWCLFGGTPLPWEPTEWTPVAVPGGKPIEGYDWGSGPRP